MKARPGRQGIENGSTMKQQYIGLKTIEAEPKTHHQFLQEIDPEIVLADYPDGPGYAFADDNGDSAWLPAEAFEEIFRASAPVIDESAIWKAVNDVVAPAPAGIPPKVPTGPRVTLERVLTKVKSEEFFRVGPTLTICVLTLENGAHVVGESACVATENFDEELGRKIAKDNAVSKIWALEGYLLREKLYRDAGRNRSIARLCYEVRRAHVNENPEIYAHNDKPFEEASDDLQNAYMGMVASLRKDPDAFNEVVDNEPVGHLFMAIVKALG